MQAAIHLLEIKIAIAENSEPICRLEGRGVQAEAIALSAAEYRQALAVLKAASSGPIWPEPTTQCKQ